MNYKLRIGLYIVVFSGLCSLLKAQQNHTMYLAHDLVQSRLLNPAVPTSCKWYIGLPVLSSAHLNYANSSFSYKQIFNAVGDGTYQADVAGAVKKLHWRNYVGTEFHAQLLGLGYKHGNYSAMFTITEKNNFPIIYPKNAIRLAWGGNSQFEGANANFKGSGIYFNHYREFALSLSKRNRNGTYLGASAKLLFGKLNLSPKNINVGLATDETTFNLSFEGQIDYRSSLPLVVSETDNLVDNVAYNDNVSPLELLLNRKNPGFAIDLGVIYPLNESVTLSASIVDLGFIRWGSNINNFNGNGDFSYEGPLGDGNVDDDYLDNILNSFVDSMEFKVSTDKYFSLLPTRALAGFSYQINNKLSAGIHGEALAYKSKAITSLSLSAQYKPIDAFQLLAAYNIQYYSLKSFGLGFVLGRNPLQFYMVSDDVPGMIWPMSSRNINLRFGLNINLGCNQKEMLPGSSGKGALQGNCYWIEKSIQKNYRRMKKIRRK